MLYILYTSGTTGKAEGHRPHDRRVSRRHLRHDQVGLRSEGRRRLLVHRGHRLGHRPQLRRLRSARQRRDRRDVRRRARLAAEGSLLGDHRALRRHDLLHRADGDPRVHAVGHRVAGDARSRHAAAARLGRRADQSRSVDLVSQAHRPRAMSDRRHVVADRNRHDHDHAAARASPARSPDRRRSPFPGITAEIRDAQGKPIATGRRPARADQAVAGDAARHLRRSRALRAAVLEPLARRHLLHRRRRARRRRRLTTGCSAAWTTC